MQNHNLGFFFEKTNKVFLCLQQKVNMLEREKNKQ